MSPVSEHLHAAPNLYQPQGDLAEQRTPTRAPRQERDAASGRTTDRTRNPAPQPTPETASGRKPDGTPRRTPKDAPVARGTFASLRLRNYRLYFFGMLLSNTGLWMSRIAQDWLVLTILTDNSSLALGTVTALQFLPMPLLAPFAGALADRFNKRRLLSITQSLSAITSLTLAALIFTGSVHLAHVYALALAQGILNALDNPTRQAFVSEMVPGEFVANAVGLNSTSFHAARLLGPAVAGVTIAAWGVGPAILVNGLSFAAVLVALRLMDPADLQPVPSRTGNGGVREGLRYVRGRPDIILVMFIVFMLGTFGMNFQITNALMATQVFGVGPEGYGLLGSVMAVGSLAGALLAARRGRPRFRFLVAALAGFTVFATAAALSPSYWLYAVLLVPLGLCTLTAMTTANASVQIGTEAGMRGRVMALYMAVFMGGTPLGAPIVGWVGDAFGARWTMLAGAVAVGLSVVVALVYQARHGGLNVTLWRRAQRSPSP